MNDYTYTDKDGDALEIVGVEVRPAHEAFISVSLSPRCGGNGAVHIPNDDAPIVALELLKAAGQESVIVPKATGDIVEATPGEYECGDGPERAYGSVSQNPNWLYNKAANYIAIAEYIEFTAAREDAEKAEAEATEKKLADRRDAIATDLDMTHYVHLVTSAALAVDRIIELEDKLAAK